MSRETVTSPTETAAAMATNSKTGRIASMATVGARWLRSLPNNAAGQTEKPVHF
jgi:hypothetical protein